MSRVLINRFLNKLTKLNRGNTPYGKAPHKPVLLITIIELIEKNIINDNKVCVDTDLVGTFQENWRLLVSTLNIPNFTLPFYHLQNEKFEGNPFWILKAKPGCQINAHISSVNTLAAVLEYGYFTTEIYLLLNSKGSNAVIKSTLLETYFPQTKDTFIKSKKTGDSYLQDLTGYILNEPETQYKTIKVETEEDEFVRGGLFKKIVPKIYNSSCCITGMRLESSFGHSFIDACHIVPFSVTHDDKVDNGLALCPNLHRAFDRGLISIDMDYKILVSDHVIENKDHPYHLKQYQGKEIKLPRNEGYYPSRENLDWHISNVFKI